MKKIEVLCWGIEHIAQNHNFASVTDYVQDGEVCIYGGCNVPTLGDVEALCEDLGLPRENIEASEFGIDVWLYEWNGEEEYKETGLELWKRYGSVIGS
ncbi:MAG: hypothetical protein K6A67_11355 [Bacteroidales bacterium]|nr:hypothetical protein [Bacteroidales bacterium]